MDQQAKAQVRKIARVGELAAGEKKLIEIDGAFIGLINVDGRYYAIDDVCTHDGGPLVEGPLDGFVIECPRHGARFDIRTGAVLSAPAFQPINTYEVRVEGEDVLLVLPE
jgi:3-phenylpropionate/trans-cinnamate dioxygenase ferredoxin component